MNILIMILSLCIIVIFGKIFLNYNNNNELKFVIYLNDSYLNILNQIFTKDKFIKKRIDLFFINIIEKSNKLKTSMTNNLKIYTIISILFIILQYCFIYFILKSMNGFILLIDLLIIFLFYLINLVITCENSYEEIFLKKRDFLNIEKEKFKKMIFNEEDISKLWAILIIITLTPKLNNYYDEKEALFYKIQDQTRLIFKNDLQNMNKKDIDNLKLFLIELYNVLLCEKKIKKKRLKKCIR